MIIILIYLMKLYNMERLRVKPSQVDIPSDSHEGS
jgi:hypothetical protein